MSLLRARCTYHVNSPHPLAAVDRGKTKVWYSDFSSSDGRMVVEYFGMNDDPRYRRRAEHKVRVYRENDIEGGFLTEEWFRGD
jgi:hypothetical protein